LDLKEQPEGWGTNPSYGSLEMAFGQARHRSAISIIQRPEALMLTKKKLLKQRRFLNSMPPEITISEN